MGKRMIIEAPAKINLILDIKGKRPDGYHELETVMHQISLADRIILNPCASGIKLGINSGLVPYNESNLAYRAASVFFQKNGFKGGIEIFIEKNIPVGAGLAGGSTDAAAVLLGINEIYEYNLSEELLLEMAAELGSDVPFCVLGSSALARGRGEILTPLPSAVFLEIVLVKPDFQLSTAEVYSKFELAKVEQFPDTRAFLAAWGRGDVEDIAVNMVNVLESVSIRIHPEIAVIKERLKELGALNAVMSGSGPSVFGIFKERKGAAQAAETLRKWYSEVYLVSSYKRGDYDGKKEIIAGRP